jgi:hypothetical protein
VDVDGVRTVAILTILWAVGFVVLAFNRERLDQAGNGWLLWTCLAGVGLGLLGIEYTRKRRDAIAEAAASATEKVHDAVDRVAEGAESEVEGKAEKAAAARPQADIARSGASSPSSSQADAAAPGARPPPPPRAPRGGTPES